MDVVTCPQCHKDDSIQKVSAAVESGRSSGSYSGPSGGYVNVAGKSGAAIGYTQLSGSSITELASLLMPPSQPRLRGGFKITWFFIYVWLISNCAAFGLLGTILLSSVFPGPSPTNRLLLVAGVIVEIVLGVVIAARVLGFFSRQDQKRKVAGQARYAQELPAWEDAMRKWNRLYYCHRDGIVFDPEDGTSAVPRELGKMLYK
jgi:hypothetical protein